MRSAMGSALRAGALDPRIAQADGAVEHDLPRGAGLGVAAEITLALELEGAADRRLAEPALGLPARHRLPAVGIQVVEEIARAAVGLRVSEEPVVEAHLA